MRDKAKPSIESVASRVCTRGVLRTNSIRPTRNTEFQPRIINVQLLFMLSAFPEGTRGSRRVDIFLPEACENE